MDKNKVDAIELFDECIKQFEKMGNLPIGARAVVLILKHYKDRLEDK